MTKGQSVAIIGGGIQGTLCALACAAAGWKVTLFERREGLWLGASRNNEGKIHRGYTYGLDRTSRTAERLADLGSRFETELVALAGPLPPGIVLSREGIYARHVSSELPADASDAHLLATANLMAGAVRKWSTSDLGATFSDDVTDAWTVEETTIEPVRLGQHVAAVVAATPAIAVITGVEVHRLEDDGSVWGPRDKLGTFDRVLNAAWDGLATLDASATGLCLRAKAGFIARATGLPSRPVTLCYGPFGDIVPVGDGRVYVSWYPDCLMGFTPDTSPGPHWFESVAAAFDFEAAYAGTRRTLTQIMPSLALSERYDEIRAGAILAAGRTDIYDPASQLHERTGIGLIPHGRIASINPGKLTAAPAFAHQAAAWLSTT